MYFPKLKAETQQRLAVAEFGGLERRPGGGAGYPAEMENLWSGGYPALETRPRRSVAALLTAPHGIVGKDGLFWVDGTGLYANGIKTGLVLTEGDKQLVGMGAYLLVFPDKKYINTQKLTEYGSMENVRTGTGTATFTLCDETGRALGSYSVGTEAPAEAAAGELWLDTGRAVSVMRQYDGSAWEEMAGVCTKIAAAGIGRGFAAGDGVTVSGCGAAELNGLHILQAAGDDWVVVPALCRTLDSQTAAVTVQEYHPPVITASAVARCGADGTAADDGAYLKVQCAAACAEVQGHNSVTVRARFRPMGGAWSGYTVLESGVEQLLGGGLSAMSSYEVELSAMDTVGNVRTVRYTAATSQVTLHLRGGGKGAAFGKYSETEGLECAWPAVFYGDVVVAGALTVNGQPLEAAVFPVGSVRLTDSAEAPEIGGAAWESVETGIAGVYGWRRVT